MSTRPSYLMTRPSSMAAGTAGSDRDLFWALAHSFADELKRRDEVLGISTIDLTALPQHLQSAESERLHLVDAIVEMSLPLELVTGNPQPPGREPEGRGR